jgi:hypothetical protein
MFNSKFVSTPDYTDEIVTGDSLPQTYCYGLYDPASHKIAEEDLQRVTAHLHPLTLLEKSIEVRLSQLKSIFFNRASLPSKWIWSYI